MGWLWADELGDLMGLRAADHGELNPFVSCKELGNAGTGGYTGVKSEVLAGAGAGNTGRLVTQTVVSFPAGATPRTTSPMPPPAGSVAPTARGLVAVGHRVVHGGNDFYRPTVVDALIAKLL